MYRFEQRDNDGKLTETFIVTDEVLKADPEALLSAWSMDKKKPRSIPEGYEHVATVDGNPDAFRTEGVTHYYAKSGSYEKEKPSKLAGLKAVVADAEAKKEAEATPAK